MYTLRLTLRGEQGNPTKHVDFRNDKRCGRGQAWQGKDRGRKTRALRFGASSRVPGRGSDLALERLVLSVLVRCHSYSQCAVSVVRPCRSLHRFDLSGEQFGR